MEGGEAEFCWRGTTQLGNKKGGIDVRNFFWKRKNCPKGREKIYRRRVLLRGIIRREGGRPFATWVTRRRGRGGLKTVFALSCQKGGHWAEVSLIRAGNNRGKTGTRGAVRGTRAEGGTCRMLSRVRRPSLRGI